MLARAFDDLILEGILTDADEGAADVLDWKYDRISPGDVLRHVLAGDLLVYLRRELGMM